MASKIIGKGQKQLACIYNMLVKRKAHRILAEPGQPSSDEYIKPPSGIQDRAVATTESLSWQMQWLDWIHKHKFYRKHIHHYCKFPHRRQWRRHQGWHFNMATQATKYVFVLLCATQAANNANNDNKNNNGRIHPTFPVGTLRVWIWHNCSSKFKLPRMMQGVIKSALFLFHSLCVGAQGRERSCSKKRTLK